jgi:hypothetical protein
MAEPTTDESAPRKIEGLVHEEQRLYGQTDLAARNRSLSASTGFMGSPPPTEEGVWLRSRESSVDPCL